MIKRKPNPGTVIEIQLPNDCFAYGQVLKDGSIAFFNVHEEKQTDIVLISKMELIFIVTPYNHAYKNENWFSLGKVELRDELLITPNKFIQDSLNPNNFEVYNPNTGDIRKSTREECIGLECTAVWEANHIEDRIIDHYNGVENVWVKQLSIK